METLGAATYSPEDNKLRFYSLSRLSAEDYAIIRKHGFIWAPKQELFVRAAWTPSAEDLLIKWCGEIEDEDKSLIERSTERAKRYEGISERKEAQANQARERVSALADNIPFGQPILVGHHSEKRARKDAQKIENGMRNAVKLWESSEYWQQRASAAISAAKYKELPAVRARRIKTIEADKRKQEREKDHALKVIKLWNAQPLTWKRATEICNYVDRCSFEFKLSEYPREFPKSQYEGYMSLWSALGGDDEQMAIVTPEQARDLSVKMSEGIIKSADRWLSHYNNRLAYEKAMLGETGGLPSDKKPLEVGGAVRCWVSCNRGEWLYITKVNKITVCVGDNWGNRGNNFDRKIEMDKVKAVMSLEEVKKVFADNKAHENAFKTGFLLLEETPSPVKTPKEEKPEQQEFDAIKESLKAGVSVISAPQLFPTPSELAARMVELSEIKEGQTVLEPSAGTGNILHAIMEDNKAGAVVAVEINQNLSNRLKEVFPLLYVENKDFLQYERGKFSVDRVIMNPPFENASDIEHIKHALKMLKEGGRLVAICANGPRQQRELKPLSEYWEDLPEGTFKNQGTNVNAALLIINN